MENKGIGYILEKSFGLYKENIWLLSGIIAVVALPMYAAMYFFLDNKETIGIYFMVMLPVGLLSLWVYAGLTWYLSEHYEGREPGFMEVLAAVNPKIIPYISTILFVCSIMFCGILLFIIPGIIWLIKYAPAYVAVIVEDKGVSPLKLSAELTKGKKWMIFLLGLIIWIPYMAMIFIVQAASGGGAHPAHNPVYLGLSFLTAVFVGPFIYCSSVALYKALREDKPDVDTSKLVAMDDAKGCVLSGLAFVGSYVLTVVLLTAIVLGVMKMTGQLDKIKAKVQAEPAATQQPVEK